MIAPASAQGAAAPKKTPMPHAAAREQMVMTDDPPSKSSRPVPPSPSPAVPLNERLIAERISTLMSHYWTSDDAQEFRALQLADWLEDLCEFPAHIVATACRTWRQTQPRRPTIAEMRELCSSAMPDLRIRAPEKPIEISHQ